MTKLVLIAGRPSHPPGAHEHRAGMLLLRQCLDSVPGLEVEVHDGGWVSADDAFDGASAVAIFADGGARHPLLVDDHLATIRNLVEERGIGLGLMHYAVELPEGDAAERVDSWIGGHYQDQVSCYPIWEARVERYFNIHFRHSEGEEAGSAERAGRVTPILVATPSDVVRQGPYIHPHGPYPHVVAASGRPESLMWAFERPDGARGFGLNGGHFHANWANDAFRKVALNALVWVSGAEVPNDGVNSVVTAEDLARNLDQKP